MVDLDRLECRGAKWRLCGHYRLHSRVAGCDVRTKRLSVNPPGYQLNTIVLLFYFFELVNFELQVKLIAQDI